MKEMPGGATAGLAAIILLAGPAHPEGRPNDLLTPCAIYSEDSRWSALEQRHFNAFNPDRPILAVESFEQASAQGCDVVVVIKHDPGTLSATAETRTALTRKLLLRSKESSDSGENYLAKLARQIHEALRPGTKTHAAAQAERARGHAKARHRKPSRKSP